jgi:hypothetical protein
MKSTLGALAVLLLAAAPLAAQDQKDPKDPPPATDEDRKLDEALDRELGDPKDPLVPKVTPREKPAESEPGEKPAPSGEKPSEENPSEKPPASDSSEEKLKVKLGFVWTHWNMEVTDLHAGASRPGAQHQVSTTYGLADPDRNDSDGFEAYLDCGRWITLDATVRHVVARGYELASRDFNFRNTFFQRDEVLETKFEFTTVDVFGAFHPVKGELGHLDLFLGVRYVGTSTRIAQAGGGDKAQQDVDALIPMTGIGGTLRLPVKDAVAFEYFANLKIGGMRYDLPTRNGWFFDQHLSVFALSIETGLRFMILDVFGIVVGYRYELTNLDRTNDSSQKYAHWRAGGMITGLVVQF